MFDLSPDERLSVWSKFRHDLNVSLNPLEDLIAFWLHTPFIPYNRNVDPYNQYSWPTPWEIIVENKYDDFTKALMIGWTLKLTKKYQNSKIELRTLVDNVHPREYNLIYVDESWVINYSDDGPIEVPEIAGSFRLENLVEVTLPR